MKVVERQVNDDDLEEAHRLISAANEAVEALEVSIRREFRLVKDALLDLSSQMRAITHKIEQERKERE
jgi:hypothetical protein